MIIIDAGHGGRDSGCVSNHILEKDLTLKISLIQERLCQIYNVPYHLTRKTDKFISLTARSKEINKVINTKTNPDRVITISNHINDASSSQARGFEIWKSHKDNSSYAKVLEEMQTKSDILFNRGVKTRTTKNNNDYYHMIREVSGRSYILEWGFIKNVKDMTSLVNNIIIASSLPIIAFIKDSKTKNY